MRLVTAVLFLFAGAACAQRVEMGATAGLGGYGVESVNFRKFATVGAEACFVCSGRFAPFAEYEHWQATEVHPTEVKRAELVAGGLRIQGGKRVRGFFDIGIAGGSEQFKSYTGSKTSRGIRGVMTGCGAAVTLGERWYIRPQARMYALTGITIAIGGSAGFGYRF